MSPRSGPTASSRRFDQASLPLLARVEIPIAAVEDPFGSVTLVDASEAPARPGERAGLLGWAPALPPRGLGDPSFLAAHGVRYPYVAGALAGGIGSVDMVVAMARAGMIGGFGAGGLELGAVEQAILAVKHALAGRENYEFNLISNPQHPAREMELVELYLRHGVARVSASGYMTLTRAVVLYSARGLSLGKDGEIAVRNHVFAKVSRPEVAREFMEPAPESILRQLVAEQRLTPREAELAARVPVAEDITVEGDSGGLTDNRALVPLLASVCVLRDRIVEERGYDRPIRVGAAGGIGTPVAVAAAFAGGAAYVLTGSINQSCVEAGTSALVKEMLCEADIGGMDMAPAADMFELGARVQVLKHRTLFAARAKRLYELYLTCGSWDEVPVRDRSQIEARYFCRPFAEVCREVEARLATRDDDALEAMRRNPKKRLAFAFRWYLHMATRWAVEGVRDREVDFQVWCGPAMAAFNHWAKGSFLEAPAERTVVGVAKNLLYGAATLERARFLAVQGVPLPPEAFRVQPARFD
jgi:trans-AT polyketide synthase, acyltransferase and oxidoreductase domains